MKDDPDMSTAVAAMATLLQFLRGCQGEPRLHTHTHKEREGEEGEERYDRREKDEERQKGERTGVA